MRKEDLNISRRHIGQRHDAPSSVLPGAVCQQVEEENGRQLEVSLWLRIKTAPESPKKAEALAVSTQAVAQHLPLPE